MATATHGAVTATMTFATAAQAGYWERYQATNATLKILMDELVRGLNAGTMSEAEYSDKMACLVDLYQQSEAAWASLGPTVAWS